MSGTTNNEVQERTKLVGYANFKRHNPMTDRFEVQRFHHLEFYCGDATNVSKRFGWGLGMTQVAKSDHSTNNHVYSSYVMQSHHMVFVFTAPYNTNTTSTTTAAAAGEGSNNPTTAPPGAEEGGRGDAVPHPGFDAAGATSFFIKHGLAVKAIGIQVSDASAAYEQCVSHGGVGVLEPTTLTDEATGATMVMSEVVMYPGGDVVMRFLSTSSFTGPFLPKYEPTPPAMLLPEELATYGLVRIDHVVGNVPQLLPVVNYVMRMSGLHEFAEFVSEDVGTVDSGLNSMVLASNNEAVLLPINEPTFGTKRKSQIQTYLEQNGGPGVQHLALKTDDIFTTMRELRKRTRLGGFEFMPRASDEYYRKLPEKMGGSLSEEQLREVEELGLLADKDDQGVLLQVFTRPVGDRPTLFLEIIQRVGCDRGARGEKTEQKAGCGGFGKGNFSELFKSIERYEEALKV